MLLSPLILCLQCPSQTAHTRFPVQAVSLLGTPHKQHTIHAIPCRLCQRLVAAKVRTALGIRGCVISGGGSLATHLDDFYEVREWSGSDEGVPGIAAFLTGRPPVWMAMRQASCLAVCVCLLAPPTAVFSCRTALRCSVCSPSACRC
jgi:hypothetical protein